MASKSNKKVLIVVAHNNFRDEEYESARAAAEKSGAEITVASTVTKNAAGSQGLSIDPDQLIDDIDPEGYDAVAFVGGTGASQFWHDAKAHAIARSAFSAGRPVAASSHAVATLAVAGLLKGRKATCHMSIYDKLQVAGVDYTGKKIEIDGNIITSSGVNAAKEFRDALAKALN